MYHIISLNWCDAHCTIHGKCYILVTMEVMFWTRHQIVLGSERDQWILIEHWSRKTWLSVEWTWWMSHFLFTDLWWWICFANTSWCEGLFGGRSSSQGERPCDCEGEKCKGWGRGGWEVRMQGMYGEANTATANSYFNSYSSLEPEHAIRMNGDGR